MPRNYVAKGVKEPAKTPQQLMREQMDELMGRGRDSAPGEVVLPAFDDPDVDTGYHCGCSPYELLKGTKSETMPQLDRGGYLKARRCRARIPVTTVQPPLICYRLREQTSRACLKARRPSECPDPVCPADLQTCKECLCVAHRNDRSRSRRVGTSCHRRRRTIMALRMI